MKRYFYMSVLLIFSLLLFNEQTAKGELKAYGSKNSDFFSINLEDCNKTAIDCSVTHLQLAFAPDGTLYATSRSTDSLYRFTDISAGELELLATLPVDCTGGDTTVSPDGKGVYFTVGWKTKELFRYDIENSVIASLGEIIGADNDIYGLAFSADGILYGTTGTSNAEKRLYTIDTTTLQATAVGPAFFGIQMHNRSTAGSLDFAPDGTLYAGIEPIDASLPGSNIYLSTINPQTGIGKIDYNKLIGGIDSIAIVPEPATVDISIDIKPGSCPNPINVKNSGVIPVAVLGSEVFNVFDIDPTSIRLADIPPLRSGYDDVATPLADSNDCNCTEAGPDGFLDLVLKFEKQAIVETLGEVEDGDELVLELTGMLYDETRITGQDCIIIRAKSNQKSK